jgi:hypothetical protein
VGVSEGPEPPFAFAAYPLPARDGVTLEYELPAASLVELAIFDLGGRRVQLIERRDVRPAGAHHARWDGRDETGRDAENGLYFARLIVGRVERVRRIVVCR